MDFNSDDVVNDLQNLNGQGGEEVAHEQTQQPVQPEVPDQQQNPQERQPQEPQEIPENPAWKPYLEKFDPQFHGQLKEILADIDSRTQRRFQRVSELERNYGQFAEQGYDPRLMAAGYHLIQKLNDDPKSFYEQLGQSLGITAEEAEDLVDATQDPEQAKLYQTVEQMQEFLQMQQERQQQEAFQQEVAQEEAALNEDIAKIQSQYQLSPQEIQGVIQRTLFLTQSNSAATIWDGLQQYLQERVAWERNRPTNNAPQVINGNGAAAATPQKPFTEKSEDEQKQELANLIANLNNS